MSDELRAQANSRRWAWTLWLIAFLAVSGIILAGNRRTVTPSYRSAALKWLQSEPIYGQNGRGFVYLPQAAILYVPFAVLPETASEILWRAVTMGSYAWALSRMCALIRAQSGRELFWLATLVTLPLAWQSSRNGQSTLPMTALMIVAAVDAADSRWWRTTLWLCLGVAIKPLAIVMLLLLAGIHAPLRSRLALGLVGMLAAPLLLQSPVYAWQQYEECWQMFRTASVVGLRPEWAQIFSALEVWGFLTPPAVQTVLRMLAAAATLGLSLYAQRLWPRSWAAAHTFALAASYLMLFNPRTENNTYSCLAPAIGLAFAAAWQAPGSRWTTALLAGIAALVVGGYSLSKSLFPAMPPVWAAPLAGTVFFGLAIVRTVRGPQAGDIAPPQAETVHAKPALRIAA
jgi:alpha-1,2-mannosyltransferase